MPVGYKSVSEGEPVSMLEPEDEIAFRKYLEGIKTDKITKILIEKSILTETQFETLLIDLFFRQNPERGKKMYSLRQNRPRISRGAFNRTRKQAIDNIVRSIYTVLLLGYHGILETPQLEPFIEAGNRLKSFIDSLEGENTGDVESELGMLAQMLRSELEEVSSRKLYYK